MNEVNKMNKMSKCKVQNFIKANGCTSFDGETKANINGLEVRMIRTVIVVKVDGELWKVPPFSSVELDETGDLYFDTSTGKGRSRTNMFTKSDRNNKVVDAYYKLIEAVK